ncbi:MAG TPA: hypothetical protein VFR86_01265 [Burkholderiaceae bacterium]|nr:hypothetical protein [Burkholderiaceae bacterium]
MKTRKWFVVIAALLTAWVGTELAASRQHIGAPAIDDHAAGDCAVDPPVCRDARVQWSGATAVPFPMFPH